MLIVTGGAGFIGSALLWKLNQEGIDDVLIVDRMGTGPKWKNIVKRRFEHVVHKDRFFAWLDEEGARANVEGVFHLGASSSTTEMDVDYLVHNNIDYTRRLWRYCAEYRVPFIYASSAATYGDGENGFVDDMSAIDGLRPLNPYGFSKQAFDAWARRQEKQPPFWAGLKFFNVYGPQEYHKGSQTSVMWQFLPQIRQNGTIKLFKSYRDDYRHGEQRRDFVYVKDCVDVMWHLYKQRGSAESGVYNVGSGKARSFLDVAHAMFDAMGVPPRVEFVEMPEALRSQYQYFTEADLGNLRGRGRFLAPTTSLEDGVRDYVQSYLLRDDMYL